MSGKNLKDQFPKVLTAAKFEKRCKNHSFHILHNAYCKLCHAIVTGMCHAIVTGYCDGLGKFGNFNCYHDCSLYSWVSLIIWLRWCSAFTVESLFWYVLNQRPAPDPGHEEEQDDGRHHFEDESKNSERVFHLYRPSRTSLDESYSSTLGYVCLWSPWR